MPSIRISRIHPHHWSIGLSLGALLLLGGPVAGWCASTPPEAAYGFDEGSGSTTDDASGHGHTGTLSGATRISPGQFGNALAFDGLNDSVNIGYSPTGFFQASTSHQTITIEAWIRPSRVDAWQVIYQLGGANNAAGLGLTNTGRVQFVLRRGGRAAMFLDSPVPIAPNVWTHVAGVQSPSGLTLYVNGQPVAAKGGSFTWATGTAGHWVGRGAKQGSALRGVKSKATDWFQGLIDEVRIYAGPLTAQEVQEDAETPVTLPPPPPPSDVTPPTATMTKPAAGVTVLGAITVAADASDNTGVVGVQFLLDGAPFGAEDLTAPYQMTWNTATTPNSSHTLSAEARDAAGRRGVAAPILVTVLNDQVAAQIGQWEAPMPLPIVAVHTTLLPTQELLLWDAWEPDALAKIWNLGEQTFTDAANESGLFCSNHLLLADGRLLTVGGHPGGQDHHQDFWETGIRDVNRFDPWAKSWTRMRDMIYPRWYPGAVVLGDGRVLVVAGIIEPGIWAETPEVYDPATDTWTALSKVSTPDMHTLDYPLLYQLPNGLAAAINPWTGQVRTLEIATQQWVDVGAVPTTFGNAVLYRSGKILMSGGGIALGAASRPDAVILDFTQPALSWRATTPMNVGRYAHQFVLLPDGSALAVGGSTVVRKETIASEGVLVPELWHPTEETWTTMASMRDPRMYHATALLLPDGRVLVSGGGRLGSNTDYLTAEIFSPPYLFKGLQPTIASAPATLHYGDTAAVQSADAETIASVVLLPLGSTTHTVNARQRYVPLTFTREGATLLVTGPANPNDAPPGVYMLFLVDAAGVPSTAALVTLQAP